MLSEAWPAGSFLGCNRQVDTEAWHLLPPPSPLLLTTGRNQTLHGQGNQQQNAKPADELEENILQTIYLIRG